eukprot:gene6104-6721_t
MKSLYQIAFNRKIMKQGKHFPHVRSPRPRHHLLACLPLQHLLFLLGACLVLFSFLLVNYLLTKHEEQLPFALSLPWTSKLSSSFFQPSLHLNTPVSDGDYTLVEEVKERDLSPAASLFPAQTLPNFSHDLSEIILSSLIERSAQSYDLHLTIFLLCHFTVHLQDNVNQQVFLRLNPHQLPVWNKVMLNFSKTVYRLPGYRARRPSFSCFMRTIFIHPIDKRWLAKDEGEEVAAIVVPAAATVDFNANYRTEILRCSLANSSKAYLNYAGRSDYYLEVTLKKNGKSLLTYRVPWQSRMTGYMSSSSLPIGKWKVLPPVNNNRSDGASLADQIITEMVYSLPSLSIDPWKAFEKSNHPSRWALDKVYMCVPGWRSPPTARYLSHLLEFIQHHLLMGVRHIFLGVCFAWHSPLMKKLLRILKPFIDEGRLSIASHTEDNLDYRFTFLGAVLRNTPVKVFSVNMCLYFAKGMADYVAIWDVDEFFIPHGTNKDLLDLLDSVDDVEISMSRLVSGESTVLTSPRKGMADGHGHPLCYIQLYSTTLYEVADGRQEASTNIWFKNNFMPRIGGTDHLAHKKAIHPTRRSFSLNLHTGGACALPLGWTDCKNSSLQYDLKRGSNGLVHCYSLAKMSRSGFELEHNFDEPPGIMDARNINKTTEGEIYHVQFFRRGRKVTSANIQHNATNHYAKYYSQKVLESLNDKGLYLPLQLLSDASFYDRKYSRAKRPPVDYSRDTEVTSSAILVLSAWLNRVSKDDKTSMFLLSVTTIILYDDLNNILLSPVQTDDITRSGMKTNLPGLWIAMEDDLIFVNKTHSLVWPTCESIIEEVVCKVILVDDTVTSLHGVEVELEILQRGVTSISCIAPKDTEYSGSSIQVNLMMRLQTTCGDARGFFTRSYAVVFDIDRNRIGTGAMIPQAESAVPPSRLSKTFSPKTSFDHAQYFGNAGETVHLCVDRAWKGTAARHTLPALLEFLQHHLLLGIKRIYIPVALAWNNPVMMMLASALRPFIEDHSVSLVSTLLSHSDSSLPFLMATGVQELVFVRICSHLAVQAGASYVAVWSSNQLYIPTDDSLPLSCNRLNKFIPSPSIAVRNEGIEIPAMFMSPEDFIEEFKDRSSGQSRFWIGDIYRRRPLTEPTLEVQYNAKCGVIYKMDGSRSVERSLSDAPHGLLYTFFDIEPSSLRGCYKQQHLAMIRERVDRAQLFRLCMFVHHRRAEQIRQSSSVSINQSLVSNAYRVLYFPRVLKKLFELNFDLLIDCIFENNPSQLFQAGDEAFADYREAYESNPLLVKRTRFIKPAGVVDENTKKRLFLPY